jgi:hypothetical protein
MNREMRNVFTILVGEPEDKRPCGRPEHMWGHNFKMDHKGMGYDCAGFIWLRLGTLVNTVMNFSVP